MIGDLSFGLRNGLVLKRSSGSEKGFPTDYSLLYFVKTDCKFSLLLKAKRLSAVATTKFPVGHATYTEILHTGTFNTTV